MQSYSSKPSLVPVLGQAVSRVLGDAKATWQKGRFMALAIAIGLLLSAILLFVVGNLHRFGSETLQILTNVAGILALVAAMAVFVNSQQTQRQSISPASVVRDK